MRVYNILTILLVLSVLCTIHVSAYQFDNIKEYNSNTKTATIKNGFGFGSDIASLTLDTPQINYVAIGQNIKVAEITINANEDYTNALDKIDFYRIREGNKQDNRVYEFKYKNEYLKSRDKFENQCTLMGNGTRVCNDVKIGKEDYFYTEWLPMGKDVLTGEVTIGIFTTVYFGDYVEWVPILYNHRIEEWAIFAADPQLVAYYKFNETSGIVSANAQGNSNHLNISGSPARVTGKIDLALNFSNTTGGHAENITMIGLATANQDMTACAWINISVGEQFDSVLTMHDAAVTDNFWIFMKTNVNLTAGSAGGATPDTNGFNMTNYFNKWVFVCGLFNTSVVELYVNATLFSSVSMGGNTWTGVNRITIGNDRATQRTRALNGTIDEVVIFNRSLSIPDMQTLYNNGIGFQYPFIVPTNVTTGLLSPPNATSTSNTTINFIWNTTFILNNTFNTSSLYIWNISGSLIRVINRTTPLCYQETTNNTNANDGYCDLSTNGGYQVSGTPTNTGNAYDGDYSTYAEFIGSSDRINITYIKPTGALNMTHTWMVKDDGGIVNVTIPLTCSDYNATALELVADNPLIGATSSVRWYCRSSAGTFPAAFTLLRDASVLTYGRVYEEGVIWNTTVSKISTTLPYNTYLWNALSYDFAGGSAWASNNFTLTITPFQVNNVTYNSTLLETSRTNFSINFTTTNTLLINAFATLYYNSTPYLSTVTCSNFNCIAFNSLDIPTISAALTQNNSFYWTITTFNGTGIAVQNTSTFYQLISRITMSQCLAGNLTLNFSAFDEQNVTPISPYLFDGSFNYYLGFGSTYRNINYTNASTSNAMFCLNPTVNNYYVDAIIAYAAPNSTTAYNIRNYFYQRKPINATIQNVPLYLLRSASSTSFVLKVMNASSQSLHNVLVESIRCYPGTNTQQIAFISRTDTSGLSVGNYEAETALYKFNITSFGQSLLFIDSCAKVVPQTVPYTLTFQVGTGYTSAFINIGNATNLTSTLVYNASSKYVTFTYLDVSNNFAGATLNIRELNSTGNNNGLICTQTLNVSNAQLTCNVSDAGLYYAEAIVSRTDGTFSGFTTFSVLDTPTIIGYYGVFLGFFIILICAFMFKFNEVAGLALTNAAIVFCHVVGLINFGIPFITASICVSAVLWAVLER